MTRIEALEREAILDALHRTAGDVGGAAAHLGMSRATVYRRIKHFGITGAYRRIASQSENHAR
ncbi:helix-turn-helix domain-containing protein [Streptomyces sp. CRN 30]|uniref:helix-turn-helix domain-containing protein n=1 Tax=Streptomyces sp. CRN 30 TaxID=3075613 RepID=UPI0039C1592A